MMLDSTEAYKEEKRRYQVSPINYKPNANNVNLIEVNPYTAFLYATEVIKGPWKRGEKTICLSASQSLYYAVNILKRRFKKAEPVIAKDPRIAAIYAIKLGFRFIEAEACIGESPMYSFMYASELIKGRFPKGETAIGQDAESSFIYATEVIKDRFPKGEKIILDSDYYRIKYIEFLDKRKI